MVVTPRESGGPRRFRERWIPTPPLSRRTSFAGMTFGLMIPKARKLRFEDVPWTKKSGC